MGPGARRAARRTGRRARRDGARPGRAPRRGRARRRSRRDAGARICGRSSRPPGLPAERLHLGATSQDVVDTALMLVAQRTLVAARSALAEAGRGLATLAEAERRSPRIARSLARHAEASTLGVLAAGWLDGVSSAIAAIDAAEFPVQFGGAVGTGTAADAAAGRSGGADAVRAELASLLGLADPGRSWHAERTPAFAVAATATAVVGALGRIAGDVTFLSREEIGEVRLAGGGGSSAMPHKQNPVDAVTITAAAVESPGLLQVVASAMVAGDERPAGRWHAEWTASRRLARLARSAAGSAVAARRRTRVRSRSRRRPPARRGPAGSPTRPRCARRGIRPHRRRCGRTLHPPRRTGAPPMTVPRLLGSFAPGTGPAAREPAARAAPVARHDDRALGRCRRRAPHRPARRGLRVLRIDLPGHGASPAATEAFTIAELADAVLARRRRGGRRRLPRRRRLARRRGRARARGRAPRPRCWHSSRCLQRRAHRHADGWAERAASVRASGTASLVDGQRLAVVRSRLPRADATGAGARALTTLVDIDDESYARCAEALARVRPHGRPRRRSTCRRSRSAASTTR